MALRRQNRNEIPRTVASLILILLFVTSRTGLPERGEFKVKEAGTKLEINSPWGTKYYEASTRLDVMKNYRVEIPLDDLKPVGAENEYKDWFDSDDYLAADLPPIEREVAAVTKEESTNDSNITVTNLNPSPTPTPSPVAEAPTDTKKTAKKEEEVDDTARMIVEANRFYNQGKYYEALLYVDEVLRRKPTFTRAWVMKGSLLYVQGHKDLAKEAWENVLKFDPENQQIQGLLQRYK